MLLWTDCYIYFTIPTATAALRRQRPPPMLVIISLVQFVPQTFSHCFMTTCCSYCTVATPGGQSFRRRQQRFAETFAIDRIKVGFWWIYVTNYINHQPCSVSRLLSPSVSVPATASFFVTDVRPAVFDVHIRGKIRSRRDRKINTSDMIRLSNSASHDYILQVIKPRKTTFCGR